MADSEKFYLLWGSGSGPCWRVMLCLEEKNLKYEGEMLSFLNYEHKSDLVGQINLRRQLPSFKHGDIILNESLGICHYVDEVFPNRGTKLVPKEPAKKALVLQRTHEALNLATTCNDKIFYYLVTTPKESVSKEVLNGSCKALKSELQIWENYLKNLGGNGFLTGPDFTLADAVFFPQIAYVARMHYGFQKDFPLLAGYYTRVSSRDSVQKTWPPSWKESEGQDIVNENFDPNEFNLANFIA